MHWFVLDTLNNIRDYKQCFTSMAPSDHHRPNTRPFTEKHPAFLWIALIAVIALLGGIALRSAKHPEQRQP